MILLDAYALVALLADEPAAGEVERLLREGGCAVTPSNLAEAVDVTQRARGVAPADVRAALEPLLDGEIELLAPREADVWRAADLRLRYYDRRGCALSLADCFLLAAVGPRDRIASADSAVAAVARGEGIELVRLPDSSGRRP